MDKLLNRIQRAQKKAYLFVAVITKIQDPKITVCNLVICNQSFEVMVKQ